MALPVLGDPQARRFFLQASLLAILVALLSASVSVSVGAAAGVVGAALLGLHAQLRMRSLQSRVRELAGKSEPMPKGGSPGAPAGSESLDELAAAVAGASARLAEARRKAEHERDDVLGILEATSEGILVLGHRHRIEMINAAARRLLHPPIDPLGRTLHEVSRERSLLEYANALRRGEDIRPRTIELSDGAGTTRVVSLSGALVRGDRLRSRAVLVLHDLTDVQRLESVRTDFVANVTHEMRSPLASILGYAETLAETTDLGAAERSDYLERILRNTHRLDDIIRDLIELSRLEHATAPQVERTDLVGLLDETVAGFGDAARDRGIQLDVRSARLPPALELDVGLVRQALTNLLDNAIKYTPAGGRVAVTAEAIEREGAGALAIAVTDTGPGIPPEHQGRIFERFYRVDTARSRSLGGTGLGLAIVKHAAALHGGAVELESGAEGSTFRLLVPLGVGGR